MTREFCDLLKSYGVYTVYGDNYAVLWPKERFVAHGVQYAQAKKVKRELYANLLPLLNSGRIELLDHPRCIAQLCSLERQVTRGGRDDINHPVGMHDDVINAVAGVAVTALFFTAQAEPIVAPVYVCQPRNIPGGSVLSSAVAAPSVASPSTSGIPSHYLKSGQPEEPWRPYVGVDGGISPTPRRSWGPI